MIAANGVTARFLEAEAAALAAACRAHAQALGAHRGGRRRTSARRCRRSPTRVRSRRSSPSGGPRTRCASPTSRSRSSSCWAPASTWSSVPGAGGAGPLRPRGQGLHPRHRAQPALPRPHHAAPAQGGARRRAAALRRRRTGRAGDALHAAGGRRQQGRAPGGQVRGRAAAGRGGSASSSTRIVTGASDQGDLGARVPPPGRGQADARASRGWTSATGCASSWSRTDVERGFIDFKRA